MKKLINRAILQVLTVLSVAGTAQSAGQGSGNVTLGYTFFDEEGSLAVNQETYNTYEGFGLSLNQWRYAFDNGMNLSAHLNNITLNNRRLRAMLSKPGLFSIAVQNNQYRRVYDFDGNRFTRRRTTGAQATFQPHKAVKLFGGFGLTEKFGNNFAVNAPIADTVVSQTDYSHSSFNVGAQGSIRQGYLRAEYRHFAFDDKTTANSDRNADNFVLTASANLPRYDWVIVSAGYIYRVDKVDASTVELKTNQGWGGFKLYLPKQVVADYRLLYAVSDHVEPKLTTDNTVHTVSLGKNWPRYGGLRVGYEYRLSDNFTSKTSSNGFLANGWLRPTDRLNFNAQVAARSKTVKEGATLLGDEDITRHLVKAAYRDTLWGSISAQWQGRARSNDDINTKVDYNTLTTSLTLQRKEYGALTFIYSYYTGTFENRSDNVDYEFGDHVISGTVYPRGYRNFTGDFGATYYRSKKDNDVEKFNLNFGLTYSFMNDHHLVVRYNVFNYDDYLLRDAYYTANIVEVNLIKDFTF
ncbi:MAG: hypothetical protein AB1644_08330 [Candidatus Zixiibacteriota bacterium]